MPVLSSPCLLFGKAFLYTEIGMASLKEVRPLMSQQRTPSSDEILECPTVNQV